MKYALVLAAAAAMILSSPAPVDACRCSHTGFKKAVANADAIFSGKLVKITRAPRERGQVDEFVFEVTRIYKGTVSQSQVVVSTVSSCGLSTGGLRTKRSYLVYATASEQGLSSRQCDRTRLLSSKDAQADIKKLGTGRAPS